MNVPAANSQKMGSNIPRSLPSKVRIMLEDTERIPPTGQFFGVNGASYMLRAGEPALVPRGIVDILDNAVESHPIKNSANQIVGSRNRHRFPYRILRDEEDE